MVYIIEQRVPFIIGSILIILGSLLLLFSSIGLISGVFYMISIACFLIGILLVIIGSEPRIRGIIMLAIGVLISIFSITLLVINITYIDLLIALIIILLLLWISFFIVPGLILIIKEEIGPSCFYPCMFTVVYIFWFFIIMGAGAYFSQTEYREYFFQNFLLVFGLCFLITIIFLGLAILFGGTTW